jgi:hypothetical protein
MGITLKKADGDLFLDPETGRPETITGASKVDQELADLYLSDLDTTRGWGSSLSLEQLSNGGGTSLEQARAVLFLRLQQANDRIITKQAQDPMLTSDEQIQQFSETDVLIDAANQAIIFFSVADVGSTSVTKTIGQSFKPTSLKHVIPPPSTGLISRE